MRRNILTSLILFSLSVLISSCAASHGNMLWAADQENAERTSRRTQIGIAGGIGTPQRPMSTGWQTGRSLSAKADIPIGKNIGFSLSISEAEFLPTSDNWTKQIEEAETIMECWRSEDCYYSYDALGRPSGYCITTSYTCRPIGPSPEVSLDSGGNFHYLTAIASLNMLLNLSRKINVWVGPGIGMYRSWGTDMHFSVRQNDRVASIAGVASQQRVVVEAPSSSIDVGWNLGIGFNWFTVAGLSLGVEARIHRVYEDDGPNRYLSAHTFVLFQL